ncbi:MAG: hypothetical protein JSU66_16760 [Deltaproteobacteria bacterium]|nr:MAG: hypothetical protein JSU66_16760 [Deltaproteobacteria bacterium]
MRRLRVWESIRRGLFAALLLGHAVSVLAQDTGSPSEAAAERTRRALEAEMERDRAREAELGGRRLQELRERLQRELAPEAERAREGDIDRQLDERLRDPARASGSASPVAGCFASLDAVRARAGRPMLHRTLRVEDFRGRAANPDMPVDSSEPATSSVELVCIAEAWVAEGANGRWRATPLRLEYRAVFLRDESWWNPTASDADRRLRHAQVHFDLAEAVARDATASVRDVLDILGGTGGSPDAAVADLAGRSAAVRDRAREDLRDLRARYDTETAQGSDANAHARWARRARAGLARHHGAPRSR